MMAKAKRISVRLNEKASAVLEAEHARGLTTREVINQLLAGGINNPEIDLMQGRYALTGYWVEWIYHCFSPPEKNIFA